jgi:serine protease Do
MTQSLKRGLSIAAIVIASVTAGILISADLGWTPRSGAQQTSEMPQGTVTMTIPSFADVAERAMPAIVSITTKEIVQGMPGRGMDPFEFFFPNPNRPGPRSPQPEGMDERQQISGGSGFIISPDGYILTNNHVVEGATSVEVRVGDNDTMYPAKIIGRDPATDIALIKIESKEPLPTLRLGDSDRIRVGEWAIAIGNPLQFENTLTVGVISAKGRSLGISEATSSFENFIQTDAAINTGNSGGPLLNIQGEVVGINTAISARATGLGFAVPVNVAKKIYPQLREKGRVTRGYLGIRIREVDALAQEGFNLPTRDGVLVESVDPGTPAAKGGIQPGDVITHVDDRKIVRSRDLIDYVSDQAPGTRVRITAIRNGQTRNLTITAAERPDPGAEESSTAESLESPARNRLGMSVQELTPAARRMFGLDDRAAGVVVTNVRGVSPAAEGGLRQGDLITEVNGQAIASTEQLRGIVEKAKAGSILRMYVTRSAGGRSQSFFVLIRVP